MDIMKLREKYNMSTRDLVKALNSDVTVPHFEITASWINKVENKKITPTYDKIKKIAEYFEKIEQKKGVPIGKIAKKIIYFNIGEDIEKIHTKMAEKGISQVLIKQKTQSIGMLTDKIIFRIIELGIKNPKVTNDFLDPLPPKIQYEDPINRVMPIFDLYGYVFVEKDGNIFGIVTRQDMIDAGFKTRNLKF